MSSVDMCEHDWPGTGCKKCKIDALEAENAELRKECGRLTHERNQAVISEGVLYADSVQLRSERDTLRQQRDELVKEMLWIIEDVWPLVHGLTSRRTLRDRFKHLPDLLSKVNK